MESPQAEFVDMVMSRLHAVELQNQRLAEENADMKDRLHQLQLGLCLKGDLQTFTDGMILRFGFGVGEIKILAPWCRTGDSRPALPLDPVHANATAFEGKCHFDFYFSLQKDCSCGRPFLSMGETNQITTVQEFVDAVEAWCTEYAASKDGNKEHLKTLQETFCGWRFISRIGDDHNLFRAYLWGFEPK